jgi:hypothetical protein
MSCLQTTPGLSLTNGVIDIALGGHYVIVDGKPYITSDLHEFVAAMPDWTTSLAWPMTYDLWKI